MGLQKIVLLCFVLIVVVGGFVLATSFKKDEATLAPATAEQESSVETEATESEKESLTGFGSFASLLSMGRNITCEYTYQDEEGGTGSGTGYFAGERMRVDSVMTMAEDGSVYNSHIINDGETMYTWTETADGTFATMMPVTETEIDEPMSYEETEDSSADFSAGQEVTYDCDSWSVDNSVFVPPSDVEFTDMGAMMEAMMNGLPEGFEMPEDMIMPQ